MSLTNDDLKEMSKTAERAINRSSEVCCLLHSDCAHNVLALLAEVRRLRRRDEQVTAAIDVLLRDARQPAPSTAAGEHEG